MKVTLRRAAGAIVLAGVLMAVLAAGLLAAALQREPAVTWLADPTPDDVARALALVKTHDPRRAMPGLVSAAVLSERDVEVLLNHAGQRWLHATTRVAIERGAAVATASVQLPARAWNPFGRWLNLQVRLHETAALPVIDSWRLGGLPLPGWLGQRVLAWAAVRTGLAAEMQLAGDVVRGVRFTPQQVAVAYAWTGDSAERMFTGLLPPDELERLRAYNDRLAELAAAAGPEWMSPLAPLVGPLFQLAQRRSAAGGDAVAENRAAIVVLTLYANNRHLGRVVPVAAAWPRPRPMRLLLAGRDDFPLHFLVSAAVAMEGTGALSKAVGIYKEIADSRGGSGFSFNDIAADRAGTRLGERAMSQPRQLQALLARGVADADLMPPWADLPEFMPEPEFKRRFGGVGAPAYAAMMAEIERRVDGLHIMR